MDLITTEISNHEDQIEKQEKKRDSINRTFKFEITKLSLKIKLNCPLDSRFDQAQLSFHDCNPRKLVEEEKRGREKTQKTSKNEGNEWFDFVVSVSLLKTYPKK